jgi:hypothetical protein
MPKYSIGRLQATDIVNLRKAALAAVGHTAASVARELGISRQTVGLVVADKATSARVEEKIAEITGRPRAELFPAKAA